MHTHVCRLGPFPYILSVGCRCLRARVLYTGAICRTTAAAGQVRNRDTPGMWDTNRDSAGWLVMNRERGFATFRN